MADRPRIAILVIHGIGEQNPFETLDSFAQGLIGPADRHFGVTYSLSHEKVPRAGNYAWESWQQSYVRMDAGEAGPIFDIYEQYWAYRMTGQATIKDIVAWLDRASLFARKYYKPRSDATGPEAEKARREAAGPVLLETLKDVGDSPVNRLIEPSTGRFHRNGYLRMLGFGVPTLLRILAFLEESVIPSNMILDAAYKLILKKARKIIIDYVGDIAVYSQIDRKAKHFEIRRQILLDARLALEVLFADPRYDGVVVAGHSLGSVIAYDTLNRVHTAPPLSSKDDSPVDYGKLKGLVTFGSPLDKIDFFFHADIPDEQWIRGRIVEDLHRFKRRQRESPRFAAAVGWKGSPGRNLKEDEIFWLNFFDRNDPISGFLHVFEAKNIPLKTGLPFGAAHVGYWKCSDMYEQALNALFPRP